MLLVSSLLIPCHKLNHHRLYASLFVNAGAKRPMVTASSSTNNAGAFTTIKERVTFEREIKKSRFIAIAGPISDERSAHSFLSEVRDPRATHNCWAYKVGDQYRSNDDGEPSSTAGKPILSAIVSSGIDRVMVVVIRYFGGIKLGSGGLVRAYGGVAAECLKNAPTCLVKSKVLMGLEVTYDLLGVLYHQVRLDRCLFLAFSFYFSFSLFQFGYVNVMNSIGNMFLFQIFISSYGLTADTVCIL
ncbi:hypothetical protein F0562_005462 [Nyssa sinensis]|uniref:Impact N-terminal domain-containing protein n=1 Tax=Nyssa sinensis TaxID=561372 RepID=A0A5J5AJF2_9ASTE|nr:hypothetical protein F0562_005462 [Nyssa sinensis]